MNALLFTKKNSTNFIASSLIAVLLIGIPASLSASPSSKKTQLAVLKSQVDKIDNQINNIDEDYLQASIKLKKTKNKIYSNNIALNNTKKKLTFSRSVLSERIRVMYIHNQDSRVEFLLRTRSFNELLTNMNFVDRIGKNDSTLIKRVFKLAKQIEQNKKSLNTNLHSQKSLLRTISSKKAAINKEINRKKNLISGLESDLRAYADDQERKQLEQARRYVNEQEQQQQVFNTDPAPMPTNAPRTEVVQIAMKYLGRPYQWGAAGPDRFDCSGFTMYVYAQVGVGLPHSSRAQSGVGQYVPRGALQPGDLLFSGSPIHHVGMYIGGGQMINSPQTGDVVKISPIRSNYVTARRP